MKRSLLVLVLVFPLACALGEVDGGPVTGMAGASGSAGSTGSAGTASGPGAGTAGTSASTGTAGTSPATGAAGACGTGVIPADVAAVISARCVACHGNPPLQGVPSSLTTFAQLTAPSKSDPNQSVAALALARMQDAAMPMPPAPLARPTAAEVGAFQRWVSAGALNPACPDGGAAADGGTIIDPYDTPPVCTSKTTWTRNNAGDKKMNPGMACVDCHTAMNEGPKLTIAGTVFPTAHEPDLCNGGAITTGARVIITGANGQTQTLTPNSAGNFEYEGTIAKPYTAKVTYMGRERVMLAAQTSGDCNSCHTQAGAMKAPGRIVLP